MSAVSEFAERVADYVETANSYDAWGKRRAMVEAVRVALEEARDDMLRAIERTVPDGLARRTERVFPAEPGSPTMEAALAPFGWTCGPDFWQRYYSDAWVFNLSNAVERLSAERDQLVALERAGRG